MAHLLDLGGHRVAAELSGPPTPIRSGVLLPPGRVALLHRLPDADVYRHGWNSWSPSGWRAMHEPPLRIAAPQRRLTADDTVWDDPTRHHSSAVTALTAGDGNVLLLGSLGLDVPRLAVDRDTVTGWCEGGDAPWFCAYGPELDVFARYAELLGEHLGVAPGGPRLRAGNVWCSWYAYYEDIDEATLHTDLAGLAGLPFDVFQIDDGWERMVGDWEPNDRFPAGMRAMAGRVADAGLRPGLWVAPFIARPESQVVREKPHLFLRDAAGNPATAGYNWGGPYYALDVTLPEARDHLRTLVERVVGWGFRYLKLDFVNAAAIAAERHDHGVGRESAYRQAMELIRETAGPDVYLLGSGAPVLPSIGVCDGIRVGPDVAPQWTNYATDDPSDATAENALVASVNRLWLKGLVELDPDVAYFRSRANLLTEDQRRLLADLAHACGFRATSDPPGWLDAAEREDLAAFLAGDPPVKQLDRYRVAVGGRVVDFTAAALRRAR
ncbi:glycoside hydrolase family 36 protein [Actinoallomurus soli]|uniref:glycoside hydrolase family 36 protein n=1 Tax=Actinoallomurus soli TaxID=2952535 RepID=UPI0020926C70|nr:glycoside hydrolase family 36 protein [Actinoallomurus soli]MCO5972886.1 alpha-galactosidase [Actinoallomurus soli]